MAESFKERAKKLVAQMTVEEKAEMLRYQSPAIPRLGIPAYNWWNEGLHGVARAGTATVFPQAIGMAATFDETLVYKIADTISTEARAKYNAQRALGDRDIYKGITMWSPNVNIFRDPRWGRGQETYGEDPFLTSTLGVKFVEGLQGDGKYLKTAACAKHFAVHSGPEKIRHEFDVSVSKKDLYETYLAAFMALVQQGHVEAVMGAYNRVDGLPCCGNAHLLTDILRNEWGFDGHVVSDCWAIRDFHTTHCVTDTAEESAAMAIKAGCDLNCGSVYLSLLQALQEGLISEEEITHAAEHVMETRFKLGMFDDDCEYDNIPFTENDTDEHAALALKAAEESMVLLKNDGTLPLNPEKIRTIAVVGPNADSTLCLEGNYNGTSSRYVTFLEGIRSYAEKHNIRVLYSQGCHLYRDRTSNLAMAGDRLAEAEECALMADVTIACVGLDATLEGEEGDTSNEFSSGDRENLNLPASQSELLERLSSLGKPLVVVAALGSAVNIPQGNALIDAFYPGQAGGTALAEIVFGEISPSGKLPVTFYEKAEDLPPFTDYSMAGRTYRYFSGTPLYPFGYGLSYTDFQYENLRWENGKLMFSLTNTGNMDADEVIQVYVKRDSIFDSLNPSLCEIFRVHMKAGEKSEVSIAPSERAFLVVDDDGRDVSVNHCIFYVGSGQPSRRTEELLGKKSLSVDVEI